MIKRESKKEKLYKDIWIVILGITSIFVISYAILQLPAILDKDLNDQINLGISQTEQLQSKKLSSQSEDINNQ